MFATLLVMALPMLVFAGPPGGSDPTAGAKWFDMENCAFCKHLTKDPELMDHVAWETQTIEKGAVVITTVDADYMKPYQKACDAMMALGKKMETGEVNPMAVKMCGHCMAWGQLMMAGAHTEMVKSKNVEVTVMTADDPAVIAQIHDFAHRSQEEMAKTASAKHEDHEHHHH
jgi:hypothetical protein